MAAQTLNGAGLTLNKVGLTLNGDYGTASGPVTGGVAVDSSLIRRQLDHSRAVHTRILRDDDDYLILHGRTHL